MQSAACEQDMYSYLVGKWHKDKNSGKDKSRVREKQYDACEMSYIRPDIEIIIVRSSNHRHFTSHIPTFHADIASHSLVFQK